jgi:alkaline phosphatase
MCLPLGVLHRRQVYLEMRQAAQRNKQQLQEDQYTPACVTPHRASEAAAAEPVLSPEASTPDTAAAAAAAAAGVGAAAGAATPSPSGRASDDLSAEQRCG